MDQLSGSRRPRRNIVPLQPLGAAASRGDGSIRQELAAGFVLRSEGRSAFGGKAENWAFPLSTPKPDDSNEHPALLEREDCTLMAWYRSLYAPRAGGAYDSHHRTVGIAGCTRRRGGVVARGGCAADGNAGDWHIVSRGPGTRDPWTLMWAKPIRAENISNFNMYCRRGPPVLKNRSNAALRGCS